MLEVGIGMMGLSSEAFWDMTYAEFDAGFSGFCKLMGVDRKGKSRINRKEVKELKASIDSMPDTMPPIEELIKLRGAGRSTNGNRSYPDSHRG